MVPGQGISLGPLRVEFPLYAASLYALPCKHLTEESGVVLLSKEVDVSGGNDAHQLATHGARSGDRDAREAMPYLGLQNVAHGM